MTPLAQATPQMKQLLLFLVCATLAYADRPPEWLRLPSENDPRPTGASAWILEDFERVNQEDADTIVMRYRYAVMPLSEAGVKDAACSIPYTDKSDKLVSARAWAMSPDGKKCRAFGGDEFLVFSPNVSNMIWDQEKTVYFQAERYLQPGWIFAYEVEIKLQTTAFDFRWNPREALPVRYASFEIIPEEGATVKWQAFSKDLPAPMTEGAAGALRWQIDNLPGSDQNVPDEMEPDSMELRVCLLEPAPGGGPASKSWSDVVRLARAEMDPKAVATPALTKEAVNLTRPGDLWSRIEPICKFVQKQITYLEIVIDNDSMAGFRPHPAGEVFENRYGDCKDKAVLLCTMLRSVGVVSRVALINSGAPRRNMPNWPSISFNHAIVAIECPKGENPPTGWPSVRSGNHDYVLFDPTNEQIPLGLLPVYDAGGLGLILAPEITAPVSIPMPLPANESITTSVSITLTANGAAKLETAEERSGIAAAEAIARDDTVSRSERTGALEKRIQRRIPLISNLTWDSSSDPKANRWTSHAHFSAQFVGMRTIGGMYVNTDLMSVLPRAEPWAKGTEGWLTFAPISTRRQIGLSAPTGWTFTEVPPDWSSKTAAGEGSMHYALRKGVLQGEIRLRITGGVLDRAAYIQLRTLLYAAAVAERRPVMLEPSARASAKPGTATPTPAKK